MQPGFWRFVHRSVLLNWPLIMDVHCAATVCHHLWRLTVRTCLLRCILMLSPQSSCICDLSGARSVMTRVCSVKAATAALRCSHPLVTCLCPPRFKRVACSPGGNLMLCGHAGVSSLLGALRILDGVALLCLVSVTCCHLRS